VRFLIDNSISHAVADALRQAGHDAAHVREYGMGSAPDDSIIERALAEDRTVIAYDLDFPRLLALRRQSKPSLIIFRRLRQPRQQIATLIRNLTTLERDLNNGCVAVFEPERIRVRDLPLGQRGRPSDD
jgi:predicted nuclease of predicted toxin-antitoxin system